MVNILPRLNLGNQQRKISKNSYAVHRYRDDLKTLYLHFLNCVENGYEKSALYMKTTVRFLPLTATSVWNLGNINMSMWHGTLYARVISLFAIRIMKSFLNKDLSTSSLMSQVPVEGHNVATHVMDTTHITYACSNFQLYRSTNDVTLRRDQCSIPPVSWLPAEGCWERIHMWHATSLLNDVNSISLHGVGIFVKIHTRVATHIR
jgi:hypothetical protein